MGDFSIGLFDALTRGIREGHEANLKLSLQEQQQDRAVFEHLLRSGDPELSALGMAGLMEKRGTGLFGKLRKSPVHGKVRDVLARLQAESQAPDEEVTLPGSAPKQIDNFEAAGLGGPPDTEGALLGITPQDFEFERRQLGAAKHPALLGSGPTAPQSLAQPVGSANEADGNKPLSPMAAAGPGIGTPPPTQSQQMPPMPGMPPPTGDPGDDPQKLIQILQPTPDMKYRIDNPLKMVAMLRLRALGGDPKARLLADMAQQDKAAGVPFHETQQKIAQAVQNAADPGGALLDRQMQLEQVRGQNRFGVEGFKQEGRERIVGMQQEGATQRTEMQQEGAMERLLRSQEFRSKQALIKNASKSAGLKPLSGESASRLAMYSGMADLAEDVKAALQSGDPRKVMFNIGTGLDTDLKRKVEDLVARRRFIITGQAANKIEIKEAAGQIFRLVDLMNGDVEGAINAVDRMTADADRAVIAIDPEGKYRALFEERGVGDTSAKKQLAGTPPPKTTGATTTQRKQFRNKQTGAMETFRLENGQWVPDR